MNAMSRRKIMIPPPPIEKKSKEKSKTSGFSPATCFTTNQNFAGYFPADATIVQAFPEGISGALNV